MMETVLGKMDVQRLGLTMNCFPKQAAASTLGGASRELVQASVWKSRPDLAYRALH